MGEYSNRHLKRTGTGAAAYRLILAELKPSKALIKVVRNNVISSKDLWSTSLDKCVLFTSESERYGTVPTRLL